MDLKKYDPMELDHKRNFNLLSWHNAEKLFLVGIRSGLLYLKTLVDVRLSRLQEEEEFDFIMENGNVKDVK